FDLVDLQYVERDMSSPAGLLAFLTSDRPWEGAADNTPQWTARLDALRQHLSDCPISGAAQTFVTFHGDLTITVPFLSNDTTTAWRSGFDQVPLLDVISQQGAPLLPGASLRGVLRAHAERIVRTLATLDAGSPNNFLPHCPACNPLEARPEAMLASCDALWR